MKPKKLKGPKEIAKTWEKIAYGAEVIGGKGTMSRNSWVQVIYLAILEDRRQRRGKRK